MIRSVLLFWLLLLVSTPLFCQEDLDKVFEKLLTEEPYELSEQKLEKMVKEFVPLIETALGKKFEKAPVCKIVTRKEVFLVLEAELVQQSKYFVGDRENTTANQLTDILQSRKLATAYSRGLLGKYSLNEKKVLVIPTNFKSVFKLYKVEKKQELDVIKMVVIHELIHNLQDQHVDLLAFVTQDVTLENRTAVNCVVEGHAVYYSEIVAKKLHIGDAVINQMTRIVGNDYKLDDAAHEMVNKIASDQFKTVYIGGRDFINYHVEKNGEEAGWKMFKAPPKSTAVILSPEKYSLAVDESVDLKAILQLIEEDFIDKNIAATHSKIGAASLKGVYHSMDEKILNKILSAFVDSACIIRIKDGQLNAASIVLLNSDKLAEIYLKGLEGMLDTNLAAIKTSPSVTDVVAKVSPFLKYPKDIAHKIELSLKVGGVEQNILFVRKFHNKSMVEFQLTGKGFDEQVIDNMIKIMEKKL